MTAVTITQIALLAWRDRERQTDRKIETQRETETERMTVTIIQIALLASGQADGNEDVPKVEFENLKVGSDRVSSAISVSVQGGAGRGRVEEDGECGVAKGEAGEKEAVLHKLCENDEAIRNVLKKAAGNGNAAWRAEGAACGGEATSVSDDELLLTVGVGAGVAQQVRAIEGGMDPPDGCDAQCPVGGNASALGRAGISAAGGRGREVTALGKGKVETAVVRLDKRRMMLRACPAKWDVAETVKGGGVKMLEEGMEEMEEMEAENKEGQGGKGPVGCPEACVGMSAPKLCRGGVSILSRACSFFIHAKFSRPACICHGHQVCWLR